MTTTNHNRPDDDIDDLLTLHEVAELLRIPEATLRYWRHQHTGPDSYKIGRHVRYRRHDVHAWLRGQRSSGNRSREHAVPERTVRDSI